MASKSTSTGPNVASVQPRFLQHLRRRNSEIPSKRTKLFASDLLTNTTKAHTGTNASRTSLRCRMSSFPCFSESCTSQFPLYSVLKNFISSTQRSENQNGTHTGATDPTGTSSIPPPSPHRVQLLRCREHLLGTIHCM